MQTSPKSIENPNNGLKLMSSKQIAEKTGKEHGHVLRDIKNMIIELDHPNLDDTDYKAVKDLRGYISEILLNEELSLLLASGYSIPLRHAIIKDWAKLKAAKPKEFSKKELALMIIEVEEEKESLLLQNAELKPKADYAEQVLKSDRTYLATEVAKDLGFISAKAFNKFLKDNHICYNVAGVWVTYAKYSGKNYTKTRTEPYLNSEGKTCTNSFTVWTEEGRQFLHSLFL